MLRDCLLATSILLAPTCALAQIQIGTQQDCVQCTSVQSDGVQSFSVQSTGVQSNCVQCTCIQCGGQSGFATGDLPSSGFSQSTTPTTSATTGQQR